MAITSTRPPFCLTQLIASGSSSPRRSTTSSSTLSVSCRVSAAFASRRPRPPTDPRACSQTLGGSEVDLTANHSLGPARGLGLIPGIGGVTTGRRRPLLGLCQGVADAGREPGGGVGREALEDTGPVAGLGVKVARDVQDSGVAMGVHPVLVPLRLVGGRGAGARGEPDDHLGPVPKFVREPDGRPGLRGRALGAGRRTRRSRSGSEIVGPAVGRVRDPRSPRVLRTRSGRRRIDHGLSRQRKQARDPKARAHVVPPIATRRSNDSASDQTGSNDSAVGVRWP